MTVMCAAAAVLVSIPLIRRYEHHRDAVAKGARIYADQLKELERDRNSGLIAAGDADLAKIEIERRLIAAAKTVTDPRPIANMWRTVALAAVAGLVILGSLNIYALNGRPDLLQPPPPSTAIQSLAAGQAPTGKSGGENPAASPAVTGEVDTMISKLATRLEANPNDADGWRMLGWSYFNTQRYDESARAYAKALEIEPANTDFKAAYAEALVQAAQGIVIPKAKEIFTEVLKTDPKEERARFYDALATEQAGDLSGALDRWLALLADAPKEAGWVPDVKQRIVDLGEKTKRDVSGALANSPVLPKLAAATEPAKPSDQQAMVDGMIEKLAAKLDGNPRDRDGWAMMIRSLKVKGDTEGAKAALGKALAIFADDPSTATQLAGMAQSIGIAAAIAPAAGVAPGAISLSPSAPALTPEAMASVQALPAADQQEMIKGMVQRLDDKLAQSPHDAEGWVRLIRARMVLNQSDLAREALKKALAEFAGDAATSGQIAASANQLGVKVE
jgi:cytochrome c-type biogenesis protein CcmH